MPFRRCPCRRVELRSRQRSDIRHGSLDRPGAPEWAHRNCIEIVCQGYDASGERYDLSDRRRGYPLPSQRSWWDHAISVAYRALGQRA